MKVYLWEADSEAARGDSLLPAAMRVGAEGGRGDKLNSASK